MNREELSVLVVGLGNREITPDALGPRVADNMMITRHVIRELENMRWVQSIAI